jgi:hypothetical protein
VTVLYVASFDVNTRVARFLTKIAISGRGRVGKTLLTSLLEFKDFSVLGEGAVDCAEWFQASYSYIIHVSLVGYTKLVHVT